MLSAAWLVCAALLCWAGFVLLAFSQERHFAAFYLYRPVAQLIRAQAAIGIIAIVLAIVPCIAAQQPGFGSLLWVLLTTASAMTVALQLAWTPHVLKPVAWLVNRLFHCSFPSQPPR